MKQHFLIELPCHIIADEAAIGMVNNKTTAVRLLPAPGKKVGDTIDVPGIGSVEVMPNNCLNPDDTTADTNNGVVLLPERAVFNAETMNNYDF